MSLCGIKKRVKKNPFLKALLRPAINARRFLLRHKEARKLPFLQEIMSNLHDLLSQDVVVRLDEFEGMFAMDCRSDLFKTLIISKNYEPSLVQCCNQYLPRHRDAIDIGANIGFFTVMFAKKLINGRVLSIEPTPNALLRLHHNIKLNDVGHKTIVFEGVATNQTAYAEIKIVEGREEYSSLGVMKHPHIYRDKYLLHKVASTTIDDLTIRHSLDPGFIKIDVEGVEHLVLEGARGVLENNRPVVLAELSNYLLTQNGSSSDKVVSMMKYYDYEVINPIDPEIPPGFEKFGHMLCVPK